METSILNRKISPSDPAAAARITNTTRLGSPREWPPRTTKICGEISAILSPVNLAENDMKTDSTRTTL